MDRDYTLPDGGLGESYDDWCRRVAESIPPEDLLRQLMAYLMRRRRRRPPWSFVELMAYLMRRRRPPWSFVADFTGLSPGVSAALVERFAPPGGEGSCRD